MNKKDSNLEIKKTIDNLYDVFSKYQLREKMNYCDCGCISKKDIQDIYSKSLNKLTVTDLEKYSHKAMSTWGDSYDFRHFFPRLAELIVLSRGFLLDSEIILGKLNYGKWQIWDRQEQEVVTDYLFALWEFVLNRDIEEGYTISDELLCAISQALEDPSPLLTIWGNRNDISATQHLYYFIYFNYSGILFGKLDNAFWEKRQEQMQIVINWCTSPMLIKKLRNRENAAIGEEKNLLKEIINMLENGNP